MEDVVRFTPTSLPPVQVMEQDRMEDSRGWFARAWCSRELADAGVDATLAQANLSASSAVGTVRGMHMQTGEHAETKIVTVLQGAILDVAVDMRDGSLTAREHVAVELSADNGRALVLPPGFAHGFQALTDDVLMLYFISAFYAPASEVGFAHDDPAFRIDWPLPVSEISQKDAAYPHLPPVDPVE